MKQQLVATTTLLSLDILWVTFVMRKAYKKQVRNIQGNQMRGRIQFGILAYILMIIGLNMFVLPNIRKDNELLDSLKYGATFGLVVYGIYDSTSAAVFKKWDIGLATVDVVWGAFVFFISAYIGSKIGL